MLLSIIDNMIIYCIISESIQRIYIIRREKRITWIRLFVIDWFPMFHKMKMMRRWCNGQQAALDTLGQGYRLLQSVGTQVSMTNIVSRWYLFALNFKALSVSFGIKPFQRLIDTRDTANWVAQSSWGPWHLLPSIPALFSSGNHISRSFFV